MHFKDVYFNVQSLRKIQHTPGAYPRHPQSPKWKEFLHKLLVGGLGYDPGVCWKILRQSHACYFYNLLLDALRQTNPFTEKNCQSLDAHCTTLSSLTTHVIWIIYSSTKTFDSLQWIPLLNSHLCILIHFPHMP